MQLSNQIRWLTKPRSNPNSQPSSLIKDLCDQHCKVNPIPHQQFYTVDELRKVRQKRPRIEPLYKMQRIKLSRYQRALADLTVINSVIDNL